MINFFKYSAILTWGILPITFYYYFFNDFNECNSKKSLEDNSIEFELLINISVYITFFLSISLIIDNIKNIKNNYFQVFVSLLLLVHILTGIIILFKLSIPTSFLRSCSNEVIVVSILCSLIPEIFIITVILFSIIVLFFFVQLIFFTIKKHIFKPIRFFDIKKISFLWFLVWNSLLIWSYISFVKDKVIIGIGINQIIFSLISLFLMKKYTNKLKYSLIIVKILGIIIYFIDFFYSSYGLTLFGIISFSGIGLYPCYFAMKKVKKNIEVFYLKILF